MSLTREKKEEITKKYGQSETDTGSAAVQIALLTEKIRELTEHLNVHRKDFSSQRGLRKMVGQRRRLMKYVKRQNLAAYKELIQSLGIRGV
ncbi:MAG TPA: 30S ribosomal protein S15 [Candidatus Acetothermia bacterium]|nr:30S ribosomal protein S15 [Candidatus Acetothermia bacterium]